MSCTPNSESTRMRPSSGRWLPLPRLGRAAGWWGEMLGSHLSAVTLDACLTDARLAAFRLFCCAVVSLIAPLLFVVAPCLNQRVPLVTPVVHMGF